MRAYLDLRPDLTRVALIRETELVLREVPELRRAGLAVRTERATALVDRAMSSREGK